MSAGPLVTPEREGKFGLIYVDPPTRVESYSAKGQAKAPPYPTMSRYDLLTLPVGKLAAPNCALVIWSTSTHLGQIMECIRVWGFEYKSYGGWGKRTSTWTPECEDPKWAFGTGRWQRSTLEIYLMAARGAPLICSHGERNFVEAPLREHSRKPDEAREALERMFPARAEDRTVRAPAARRLGCLGRPGGYVRGDDMNERALRERIGELEEENRQLREALKPSHAWPSAIRNAVDRAVLSMLLARSPNIVTHDRLMAHSIPLDWESRTIRWVIWRLRKNLAPLDIEIKNILGEGYYLDAASAIRARKLPAQNEGAP